MHTSRRPAVRGLAAAAVLGAVWPLVACAGLPSPIVALEAAPDAASPACAAVSVRLPDEIEGMAARETNAQATGAWGNPTAIVLHCGAPVPPPTSELPCVTPPGGAVDWLIDDTDAPNYVFTSYGRSPAVTVAIDNTVVSGVAVLDAIDVAVSQLPQEGACVAVG